MLTRLYIDNFRCFVNFELKLGAKQLLIGRNGTGKSSLLQVLAYLKLIADGESVSALFPSDTRTRWNDSPIQKFAISVALNGGIFQYELEIEHQSTRVIIKTEKLDFSDQPVFRFIDGTVTLHSADRGGQAISPYSIDQGRSTLATAKVGPATPLESFKSWLMLKLQCFIPNPTSLRRPDSVGRLWNYSRNNSVIAQFPDWYQYVRTQNPDRDEQFQQQMRSVIDGFRALDLVTLPGTAKLLFATFAFSPGKGGEQNGKAFGVKFDELSDGQRYLIVLYALLMFAMNDEAVTVVIDEPDNYLALFEIQPWLLSILDRVDESDGQVILISHHPELLNQLAGRDAVILDREEDGRIVAKPFVLPDDNTLPPAEIVARGWELA